MPFYFMRIGPVKRNESITVDFFLNMLGTRLKVPFEKLNHASLENRTISERDIHRPGLALAGFTDLFTYHRVQIIGNTEAKFLQQLSSDGQIKAFESLISYDIPLIALTENNTLPTELINLATEKNIPIIQTKYSSAKFIYLVTDFLDDQFSPQQTVHGVLIDVYGIGILLVGRSGIGKSEIGLDLVERGHRLVSDDVVLITRKGEEVLMGTSNNMVEHFMEIRGVGIIDVRSIFGVRAIRYQKRVEVVVQLLDWDTKLEYTRTGLDDERISILDVNIPLVNLPIYAGKNVTVIIEVIALNHLLKHYGYDSAQVFATRLQTAIKNKSSRNYKDENIDRTTNYFEHDFE